ncbi:WD domain repeat-containing protein 55 [Podochytrium sp. JEL0797]|nr:WD domain repeat-containing protein 55 [Podochytrium sp. JEL0797]
MVVTGDEGGIIKIWDTRERKLVMKYAVNEDYISDFAWVSEKSTLLATSADGKLSVFDIRKKKPIKVSDNQEDELLSVVVVKDTKKAVVGSEDGILSLFSWDNWGDLTDRIPTGHPDAINSILKLSEDRILTGCSDGQIRLVTLFPNKVVSSLRDHVLELPIERIRLNADGGVVASCSHEEVVRFWDVADLGFEEEEEDSDEGFEHLEAEDSDDFEDVDDEEGDEEEAVGQDSDANGDCDSGDGDEMDEDEDEPITKPSKSQPAKRTASASDEDSDSEPPIAKQKKPSAVKKHRPNATQNAYFGDLD